MRWVSLSLSSSIKEWAQQEGSKEGKLIVFRTEHKEKPGYKQLFIHQGKKLHIPLWAFQPPSLVCFLPEKYPHCPFTSGQPRPGTSWSLPGAHSPAVPELPTRPHLQSPMGQPPCSPHSIHFSADMVQKAPWPAVQSFQVLIGLGVPDNGEGFTLKLVALWSWLPWGQVAVDSSQKILWTASPQLAEPALLSRSFPFSLLPVSCCFSFALMWI